jgi:hypothetical protein
MYPKAASLCGHIARSIIAKQAFYHGPGKHVGVIGEVQT